MKTEIEWIDPKDEIPPFDQRILALLGGHGTNDAGQTWHKYVVMSDVVMRRESPNEEEEGTEYAAFVEGNQADFDQFQFVLVPWDELNFGRGDDGDWYSDSIVRWAHFPDFSSLI